MNRKTNKSDSAHKTNSGYSTTKRGRTKRVHNGDIDDTDNTSHLADPPDEVNLREVQLSKTVPNVKQHELAPVRGGTMLDLDVEHITALSDDSLEDTDQDQANQYDRTNFFIVPSYASWFSYASVHPIEKRSMPEYISNLTIYNPDIYIKLRNNIIDAYRMNPTEYLNITTCSRKLGGDIYVIVRIHAFLEQWGLINYQIEPELRPTLGPPSTNHFHLIAENSDSFTPLESDGKIARNRPNYIKSLQVYNPSNREDLDTIHDREHPDNDPKLLDTNFGLRLEDYSLLDLNFQSRGAAKITRDWNETETLALLEAIELYKDDWHKVCEHVDGRTQDECILHFLRLPIEDPFLVEDETPTYTSSNGQYQPIPFSKSGNPIMSTIALLASAVDSSVAASAARAALQEFSKQAESDEPAQSNSIQEECLTSAATEALKAAATKAKYLATIEERKIKSLITVLIDTQLKKLNIKLKYYEELDSVVDKEKETTDNQRKQLAKEQQEFQDEQVRAEKFRAGSIKVENMLNPPT